MSIIKFKYLGKEVDLVPVHLADEEKPSYTIWYNSKRVTFRVYSSLASAKKRIKELINGECYPFRK